MKIQGVLKKISAKSGTSKKGPWTAYSLGIDRGTGDLTWVRYGFKAPGVTEGSAVSFDAKEDNDGNLKVQGEISVDKKATAKAAVSEDHRSDSIVRQNASSTAARVVRDMIDVGAVVLPKAANAKYDAYLEVLKEVTDFLFLSNRNAPTVAELQADRGQGTASASDDDEDVDEESWPET